MKDLKVGELFKGIRNFWRKEEGIQSPSFAWSRRTELGLAGWGPSEQTVLQGVKGVGCPGLRGPTGSRGVPKKS